MAIAILASKRSPDPIRQVGACIVNDNNEVVGTGYNCMPKGCEDICTWNDASDKLLYGGYESNKQIIINK